MDVQKKCNYFAYFMCPIVATRITLAIAMVNSIFAQSSGRRSRKLMTLESPKLPYFTRT